MKVKITKAANWSIHHAWGPEFQTKVGMVLGDEFPKNTNADDWGAFKHKLLEAGHAVQVKEEKKEEVEKTDDETEDADKDKTGDGDDENKTDKTDEDKDKDVVATPESLKVELEKVATDLQAGLMGSEKKAKAELETIGKERYQFDVDKRMTLDKMISAIVEAAFKAE